MDMSERERTISSLIDLIAGDTAVIAAAIGTIEEREESRTQATYRLIHLLDVRFSAASRDSHDRMLHDFLLLEIYRAGALGAPISHLKTLVENKFGNAFTTAEIREVLGHLRRGGEVIDRSGFWFSVPHYRELMTPETFPTDMRSRIIQILQAHPEGLRLKEIRALIEERYKVVGFRTTLSSVLTKLKQAGTILHANRLWSMPRGERTDAQDDPS